MGQTPETVASLAKLGRMLEKYPGGYLYGAEELLRIRDREGRTRPLIANPAQLAFEANCTRSNIVLKARQMGLTTWIAGRMFLKTITRSGVLSVQVAHTREAAENIFAVAHRFWENLPEAMRHGPLTRSRANVGQMVFDQMDSEFRVVSAADENAGRGATIQNLHLSEVSRWPGDAGATLAGLRAALAPGGEITLESTPAGAYGCFYEQWMQAPETGTSQHFFPWWLEPAYVGADAEKLSVEEEGLVAQHGLTRAQIGFRRTLGGRFGALHAQEFAEDPLTCFRSSGSCCFEVEAVDRRAAEIFSEASPLASERGGALLMWFPPLPDRDYLVAVDTAGGGSTGDYAAIQVIALDTGLQCAELRERLAPLELARVAAMLGRRFRSRDGPALIAVERNNHGAAVLANLDQAEHYARVYAQEGVAGWLTSAGSKPAMISRMGVLLAEAPQLFRSARLLAECRTFVIHANGGTGAANGTHDDCLMAMAIAQAVRAEMLSCRTGPLRAGRVLTHHF